MKEKWKEKLEYITNFYMDIELEKTVCGRFFRWNTTECDFTL